MLKALFRCSIVGGVVVYLWMMISWTLLPFHQMTMNRFENQDEIVTTLLDAAPADGIYVAPFLGEGAEPITAPAPYVFVNIKRGVNFQDSTRPIALGILTHIVGAFFITYLLLQAKTLRYWHRVFFVAIVGLIVGILGLVPAWNWAHFPPQWMLVGIVDAVIAWFLGGLVIAKLVKN